MKNNTLKTYEVRNRSLVTLAVIVLYILGRGIILHGVDPQSLQAEGSGVQDILLAVISGDRYRYSVFALGIMPYITVSVLVTLVTLLRSSEAKARTSPRRVQRATYILTMIFSLVLAISRAQELPYRDLGLDIMLVKALTVLELLAGAAVILVIATVNRKHGFAGQMPIILVNVVDNLVTTVRGHSIEELQLIGTICICVTALTAVMESVLVRIPVLRVSIHNVYADKSYIAYKLNPIGTMPVMFATIVFMLFQLIVRLLLVLVPDIAFLQAANAELVLTRTGGVWTYLCIVLLLTILGSFLMLSPGEAAERLQKGGDSIVGVYAGKQTTWYIRKKLLMLSFFSGIFMSTCMGTSMFLSLHGKIPARMAMLPSMAMILTSTIASLVQEVGAYLKFDAYKAIDWE